MIAARPCVLRFVSLTHTHTTLSLKGTGDRKGARAAGQAGNQHVDVHVKTHAANRNEEVRTTRWTQRNGVGERILYGLRCMFKTRWMIFTRHPPSNAHDAPRARPPTKIHLSKIHLIMSTCPIVHVSLIMPSSRIIVLSSCVRGSFPTREGRSSCARRRRRGARPCAARPVASQPLRNYSKNR